MTAVCSELKQLCSLREAVSEPQGSTNTGVVLFEREMQSFLEELDCPHTSLRELDILTSFRKKLVLFDFLLSELLAARLTMAKTSTCRSTRKFNDVAGNLERILKTYNIGNPPPGITPRQVFNRIIGKVYVELMHVVCTFLCVR